MFIVYFIEEKNILLNQLRKSVPSVGENVTIKGRKGKVSSVTPIDEKNIHVEFILEKVKKNKPVVDHSKKIKR